jgi:predicted enzyme related to lactoylglutathione lyase
MMMIPSRFSRDESDSTRARTPPAPPVSWQAYQYKNKIRVPKYAFCMPISISRVTISVADVNRSSRLYADALGLPPKYEMPGIAMLVTSDGVELQLHERPPTPGDAGVAISFGVDDVDAVTKAAVAAGASIIKEPADQPWGERQSVLRDVDGHVFCLVAPLGR